jgi:peptidoglycan/xylan/chitin deacetylase (PgdA/CDA1 family)
MDKPALITLTFDDGLRCQFQQAVPILNQYGFPATFFLVANTGPIHTDGYAERIGFKWPKIAWNADDIRFLKAMVERGHEIGAHSVNHKLDRIVADPAFEAAESKRLVEEWMETEIPSYCYPFYRANEPIRKAVIDAGYKQARSGKQNSYIPRGFSDSFQIDCREISNNENVAGWVQPGCWHVLTFHGIGGAQDGYQPIPVTEFARQMAELAKLRDSGAVEVVTFGDGADRLP